MARVKQQHKGPCPTYFRAGCATARKGGRTGYKLVAEVLTQHLGEECPVDSYEEWQERIDELTDLLRAHDRTPSISTRNAALAWFDAHLPRCMALVPRRRRDVFLDGVHAYVEEHDGLPDAG